jgi:transposase
MPKKSVPIEIRHQIIGLSKDKTKSNVEIARLVGVSEKCVRTTKKNFYKNNVVGELPRPGRPQKLSYRDENWIFRQVREDPKISNGRLAAEFSSREKNVSISRDTVRRSLKKRNIGTYTAQKKPFLTKKHMRNRFNWCKERLHWDVEKWSKVIFSDESNYEVINRKSRVLVKRLPNEKYHSKFCSPRQQGGGGSAGIWGCISHKGTGVCEVYTGRINQYTYKDTLENALLPSVELMYSPDQAWIFQQDGASSHTAKSISKWLTENKITLLPWPPKSPDLSPIESIWQWIDRQLVPIQMITVDELKEAIQRIWLQVPKEMCMSLVESMPKRVRACYAAKGGHFKY